MEKAIRRYAPIFIIPTFAAFAIGFIVPFLMAVIPVIVFYLSCQKYIIKGVAAGAVKG